MEANSDSFMRAIELAGNNTELLAIIRDKAVDAQLKSTINDQIIYFQSYQQLPDTQWSGDLAGVEKKIPEGVQDKLFFRDKVREKITNQDIKTITMHYSIDNEGHFLRGYTRDNLPLDLKVTDDQDISDLLNKNLQAWLTTQGWASTDGVIHTVGEHEVPVRADQFINTIENQETGYVKFSAQNNLTPSFNIGINDINKQAPISENKASTQGAY